MADDADTDDEVDCSAVVEQLYTFLDGELTDGRRVQIERHFHGCMDCHEVVEFHASLRMTISSKCQEEVPESLRRRIAEALQRAQSSGAGGIADR